MTSSDLHKFMAEFFANCVNLATKKNHDYARQNDALFNLRRGGPFGIAVRLDDKVSRLLNMMSPGHITAVEDEGALDTLRDIANYAALCVALIESRQRVPVARLMRGTAEEEGEETDFQNMGYAP